MSNIIFNGIDSRTLGLIIPETPFRPSWAKRKEEIVIAGRSEALEYYSSIYENQIFPIDTVITDISLINKIYSIFQGKGKLIVSTNPNEYLNVSLAPLVPKGVALRTAELPLSFDCRPFAYAINPTIVDIGTVYTEVDNKGSIYAEPVIEIKMKKNTAPILKGDVNFDGKIDSRDASMVLAEYSRLMGEEEPTFTPEQFEAADMNNDGKISATDASTILNLYAENSEKDPEKSSQNIIITTNGADLIVGIPDVVVSNGLTVTIDKPLHLIYYTDADGNMVNIMQYSSLDIPSLHEGVNYMKYTGDNVESVTVTVNERWL